MTLRTYGAGLRINDDNEPLLVHTLTCSRKYLLSPDHSASQDGLTENAGHENDGPSKLQDMKLQDKKLTDQCAGHENAGHEIDGPIFEEFARHEIAGRENEGPICRA